MPTQNSKKYFDYDVYVNPRVLRGKVVQQFSPNADLEVESEEQKELFLHKHTYKFKENVLYNNLSSHYLKNLNFDLSNLHYYQNFFQIKEDFDTKNRELIQNLREEYLKNSITKNEITENKSSTKTKKEHLYKKIQNSQDNAPALLSLVSSLINILNKVENNDDKIIKITIISRLFDNLLLELKYKDEETYLKGSNEIEKQLYKSYTLFESVFFSGNKREKTSEELILILEKMEIISMKFQSSALFLKVLLILKKNKITLNNFSKLYKKYFKKYVNPTSLILLKDAELSKQGSIQFLEEIRKHHFFLSDNYVYLIAQLDSYLWRVLKLTIENGEVIVWKENTIEFEQPKYIQIMDGVGKDYFNIMLIDNNYKVKNIKVSKDQLIVKSKNEIYTGKGEILTTFISQKYFFILYPHEIVKINSESLNEVVTEKFKLQLKGYEDFSLEKDLKNNDKYFFINDEYVYFPVDINVVVFKINSNAFRFYHNRLITIDGEKVYFNHQLNVYCTSKIEGNSIQFREYFNDKLKILNFRDDNLLNEQIMKNKKELRKKLGEAEEEKDEFDFKSYLCSSYFDQDFTKHKTKLSFIEDNEQLANSYFSYFFFLIVKDFIYYGNIDEKQTTKNLFILFLSKTFVINVENNILLEQLTHLIEKRIFEKNSLLYNSTLFIIKSLIIAHQNIDKISEDITSVDEYLPPLEKIMEYCFNCLNNQYSFDIVLLLSQNEKLLAKINDILIKKINDKSVKKEEKIDYLLLLINKEDVSINAHIEDVITTEKEFLISEDGYENEIFSNKINYLQSILLPKIIPNILNWNCEIVKDSKNSTSKLFFFILSNFSGVLQNFKKSVKNIKFLKNSLIFKLFYLFINKIISQKKENLKNVNIYQYFSSILNITVDLDFISSSLSKITHNLVEEDAIIVQSQHPCENDQKKIYTFEMNRGVSNKINFQFNAYSSINKPGSISINNLGPYHESIPNDNCSYYTKSNKITIDYQPQILNIIPKDIKMSYGFMIKASNYDNDTEVDKEIIDELSETIIYSVGSLLYTGIKDLTEQKGKENLVLNNLFSTKLFENFSVVSSEKYSLSDENEILSKMINNITSQEKKDKLHEILEKIKLLNLIPTKEIENVDQIIQNIIHFDTIEKYKNVIEVLHKAFLSKNVWGNLTDRKTRPLIMILFSTVLKNEKLLFLFDEFVTAYSSSSSSNISEIPNFKLFYSIYSEISKIKIWFNQKEKDIAEEVSKRKETGSKMIEEDKDTQIEIAINEYFQSLIRKANFLLSGLKTNSMKIQNLSTKIEKKNYEFNHNIQDIIDSLLLYIENDEIEINTLKEKIVSQNKFASEKESALFIINIFLSVVSANKSVKNLIYWCNKIIKGENEKSLVYFNHDVFGADMVYSEKIKMQIYTYIMIILDKLNKEKNATIEKSKFDNSYYLMMIESLIWPFKKRDYPFIQISKFFDLFDKQSIIAQILNYNDTFLNNSKHNLTFLFEVERINISKLYHLIFEIFSFYSFIVFDKFNEINFDENPFQTTGKKSLTFKRRVSELDENESFKIIKQISDIIFNVFEIYLSGMYLYKKNGKMDLLSEEKLNSFLVLFYRSLSFNEKLISFFEKNYSELLCNLFNILIYSSPKNKYICIKLIEMFLLSETNNEQFITSFINDFKVKMEKTNPELYSLLTFGKTKYFFVHFLFSYAMLLQQSENHAYFFKTEIDFGFSFDIIELLRNIMVSSSTLSSQIEAYINEEVINNKTINTCPTNVIAMFLLGIPLNVMRVGSKVLVDIGRGEKGEKEFSFADSDNEEKDQGHQVKQGIIIGFSDVQKAIFNFNHGSSNDNRGADNSVSFTNFYYLQKKYAYIVLEENITKTNMKNLSFDVLELDTNEIKLAKENYFLNPKFAYKISSMKVIDNLINMFDSLIPKIQFLTLTLIKQRLYAFDSISSKISDIIKPKIIDIVFSKSLSSLDVKQSLIPLEFLQNTILSDICKIKLDAFLPKKVIEEETNTVTTSHSDEYSSEDQATFFIGEMSLFAKFNGNLIKEILYQKILNATLFSTSGVFLPTYNYTSSPTFFVEKAKANKPYIATIDFSLFSPELVKMIEKSHNCLKYIITNNEVDVIAKDLSVPVIVLEMEEYNNCIRFLFEKIPSDEYEEFYMESIQKDFTMLIDIPLEMINETAHLSQRDLILNVIQDKDDKENTLEIVSDSENVKLSEKEIALSYQKLLSMISRRITMVILTHLKEERIKMKKEELMKITKLLLFEMNVYQLDNNILSIQLKETNVNKGDIVVLFKRFIQSICENMENKWENDVISSFLDLDFLRSVNYIDFGLIQKIESEKELLKFENVENSLKIIFFLLPLITSKNVLLFDLKDYEMKLFMSLTLKINDFSKSSNRTFSFMLDILHSLLKRVHDTVKNQDISSENKISAGTTIESLKTFKSVFFSNEFISIAERANSSLSETKPILTEQDAKIVNLVFLYLDLAFQMLAQYDIDLNLKHFFNMKIINIYFTYSLMNKEYSNKCLFLLFFQKRGLLLNEPEYNRKKTISFSYYDTQYSLPHIMKFSSGKNEIYENVSIKVKSINSELIQPANCVFVYKDQQCKLLQDYFRYDQNEKEFVVQNENENQFYVSFPYVKFRNNLYGCGSNEKQSLGCGGDAHLKYAVPRKCIGLEDAKNIQDFKFGYFHTFVQTTDGNLFTCGNDSGSSFKERGEYSSFNLNTHFNDIAKKEGIVGVWVNNFNASILLTKENNLYGCGHNNEYCLTNKKPKGDTVHIPFLLTPIKQKVLEVACGFKSSFFILEDGSAMTVGSNQYHQMGSTLGDTNGEYYALQPPLGGRFRHVVAGEEYFVIIVDEEVLKGRLYTMGCNENGRSGVGRDTSNKLQKCKGVECYQFKVISSRNDCTAAIATSGELFTFGFNEEGALGIGNTSDAYKPTLVEGLKDYICDDVGISHHHMLVIARSKITGEKMAFSCGTNEFSSLACERKPLKILTPMEINHFKQNDPEQQPIRVTVSRYQSYFLTLENELSKDVKGKAECQCSICKKNISYVLNFSVIEKTNKTELYCDECIVNLDEKTKKIAYSLTTLNQTILDDITKCNFEPIDYSLFESKEELKLSCVNCGISLTKKLYISSDNENLVLCHYCFTSKCWLIEYPQVFYYFHNVVPNINTIIANKTKGYSNKLYPTVKKADAPFLTLEVTTHLTKYEEFKMLLKDAKINKIFESFWKKISNVQLFELNRLKDQIELEQQEKEENVNVYITSSAQRLYEIINQLVKEAKDSPNDEVKIANIRKYYHIKELSKEDFTLLFELSDTINNSIFDLLSISNSYKDVVFFHKTISENLEILNSKERLNIFNDKLDKLKVNVNPGEKSIDISRIKAAKFYESNTVDSMGISTVFGQLFQKMKKYPIKNYLSQPENRLFVVTLLGEGSTDYGGPYRDVLTTICDELQSKYLDLFIRTPNHKNDIGLLRDKWIPNPSAKKAVHQDMYFFIGCMLGHAISSGHLLSLNLHPLVWNKILSPNTGVFGDFESVDKLFFKYINEIEKTPAKTEEEFNELYPELNFSILLSDESEIELIRGGKTKKVTLSNKAEFVELAKKWRLSEFNLQVESIRSGLTNVIPESIFSLLMGKELEELACGKQLLNVTILKQFTEYQGYSPEDKVIINFWNAINEFSNDERIAYLKYVWGRSRLPDPNIYKFIHTIAKTGSSNPDKRLPTATTCYFTLKLPNYSTYEILRDKLRYVIQNCSEIDTDFTVSSNEFD